MADENKLLLDFEVNLKDFKRAMESADADIDTLQKEWSKLLDKKPDLSPVRDIQNLFLELNRAVRSISLKKLDEGFSDLDAGMQERVKKNLLSLPPFADTRTKEYQKAYLKLASTFDNVGLSEAISNANRQSLLIKEESEKFLAFMSEAETRIKAIRDIASNVTLDFDTDTLVKELTEIEKRLLSNRDISGKNRLLEREASQLRQELQFRKPVTPTQPTQVSGAQAKEVQATKQAQQEAVTATKVAQEQVSSTVKQEQQEVVNATKVAQEQVSSTVKENQEEQVATTSFSQQKISEVTEQYQNKKERVIARTEQLIANIKQQTQQTLVALDTQTSKRLAEVALQTQQKVGAITAIGDRNKANIASSSQQRIANIETKTQQLIADITAKSGKNTAQSQQRIANITTKSNQLIADIRTRTQQKLLNIETRTQQQIGEVSSQGQQKQLNITRLSQQKRASITEKSEKEIADITTRSNQKLVEISDVSQRKVEEITARSLKKQAQGTEDYSASLNKAFTKLSQSSVFLSRGIRSIGQVLPFNEMKGLTTLATHLTNTLRGAVYVLVNFNKGVSTLAEISSVTGKSLAQLTGVVLGGFVGSVKTLRELLASNAAGGGFFKGLLVALRPTLEDLKEETINLTGVLSTRLVDVLRGSTGVVKNFNKELSEGKTGMRAFINSLLMSEDKNLNWIRELKKNLIDAGKEARNLGKELQATLLNPKLLSFVDKGIVGTFDLIIGGLTNLQSAIGNIDLSKAKGSISSFAVFLKNAFPETAELFNFDSDTFQILKLYLDDLKSSFISLIPNAKTFGQALRGALDIGIANTLDLVTKGVIGLDNAIKNLKVSNLQGLVVSFKGFFDGLKESFPETIEAFGNLKNALGNLGTTLTQPLSGLKDSITGLLTSANVPLQGILSTGVLTTLASAVGGVTVAFFGLKNAFAQLANLDMLNSFNSIIGSAQEAESFLLKMNEASKGTINTVNVIRSTNLALTEVSETLRGDLINALPRLLEVATIQARATGDSVDHLFNSLVTGIKRGSSLLIDNTGIVIKIGEATKTLADSLGKTVEELTAEERQLATLNAVLLASDNIIGKLGGSTASTNQIIQKMKVEWQNFGLIAGKAFEPLINALAVIIAPLNTIIVLIAQNLLPVIQLFSQSISMVVNTIMMGLQPIIDLIISSLQRFYGTQNNLANSIMAFLVPAFDVLGKAFYAIGYVIAGIVGFFVDLVYKIGSFVAGIVSAYISTNTFIGVLWNAIGGMGSFQQGIDNFNMGLELVIALFDRIGVEIGLFIDNSLIGIANWTGMVVGIFDGMRFSVMSIMTQLTQDIASIFMGDSPPPKGALSTIDRGAENVMLAWIDGFTGVSMQPIHSMVGGISDIVSNVSSSITSFKFIDNVFDTIDNRLKALQEQYNNFKKVVDNSFELLNNKQNDLIKYLNMGDQSVLSTIRALDVQKESANELLNIRREQYLLSENELLVMQSQLGMQTAIANVEDNLVSSGGSGGSGTSDRSTDEPRQPRETTDRTPSGGSGGSSDDSIRRNIEATRARIERARRLNANPNTAFDRRYMREIEGYLPLIGDRDYTVSDEELSVADRRARRDSELARRGFTGIDQYMGRGGIAPVIPDGTTTPSLGSRIGDAFQSGRGTGLDFFSPKPTATLNPQVSSLNAFERSLQKSSIGKELSKFTRVLDEIGEAFNKLKDVGSSALEAIGIALQPLQDAFDGLVTATDNILSALKKIGSADFFGLFSGASYMQPVAPEMIPASNPLGSAPKRADMGAGQKTQQTIFDQLSDSIDNLILTLPSKLTIINGLFTTLFELPMQQLIGRMFGLTSPTSILYIFNKVMLTDIPNVLQTFISTKWVLFKEQMVQTFVDLESLLSRVILYPIIRILNGILSGFQLTMESLAEGLNTLIAFYNSLPPSIRGSSEQLQEFSIDKLKFKLIDVPTFAKGGIGSGMISVGEHGQEYVAGSKLAVFPNSYVTATNHLARQLSMVNSTIRGNQQYNNNSTSNVDRSLTANIYTSRMDTISLTQLQAIRG